jgi:multiple sugar transport system permease protein
VRIAVPLVNAVTFLGVLIAGGGPLLFLFKSATSTTQDTLHQPLSPWPHGFAGGNISDAWSGLGIGRYLLNTVFMAVGAWLATLIVCVTGAYVLSVLRPKWGPVLSGLVLATLFIPHVVSLVPLYLTILHLPVTGGTLMNTYWAVWLPPAAGAFNVIVVKRFFDAIPRELFEAARVDGAGPLRMLWSIVLPLSRPILGVVSLLSVIASWKEFLLPLLVLTDQNVQPLSVALPQLARTAPLSVLMAALFLSVIIPVALFLVFQKSFFNGVRMSAGVTG